ncbi:hypothetical protein O1R50_19340 [Glycomyces luteolus]|uniref:Pyrroloquinoline-quinone binding quinoprotein n=1 Tax=Glycomyces luteolus TaxID=2670330 RepID=A0A9X3PAF6_9ACTN|nr:hypothetical protein [Glycomyces luteolus]MDA1361791.1 hypothetical protein [Glycomyces luteolus]
MRDRFTSLCLPLSCAATLFIATACTADPPEGTIDPAPGGDEAAEISPEGPPIAFDPVPILQSPAKTQFIDGTTYYGLEFEDGANTSLIRLIDLEDQTQISEAVPEHDQSFSATSEGTSVRFAYSGEEVLLFHAFGVDEGEDKQISLRTFDTADGSLRFTGAAPHDFYQVGTIDIAQSEGDRTLVTVDGTMLDEESYRTYDTASSYLFDSVTGELIWQSDGFKALRVEGETVIGTAYTPTEGDYFTETALEFQVLPLSGGEPSYAYPPVDDFEAKWLEGSEVVLLQDGDMGMLGASDGFRALLVAIDAESGAGTKLAEVVTETEPDCSYDGVAVIGCVGFGEDGLTAMSAADGSVLWTDADITDYLPPDRIRGAAEGVFYMDNEEGARPPIVVEAATGVKLAEDLPSDFVTVFDGYGFGVTRDYGGVTTMIYEITERYEAD